MKYFLYLLGYLVFCVNKTYENNKTKLCRILLIGHQPIRSHNALQSHCMCYKALVHIKYSKIVYKHFNIIYFLVMFVECIGGVCRLFMGVHCGLLESNTPVPDKEIINSHNWTYCDRVEERMGLPWNTMFALWHDDVIKWKHFPRYWPFVRGIHRSRWIPRTKASDAEPLCFLWSAPE